MKVVLTVHQFLPDHWSGTELITYNVARELQARGHDVTVFTGYPAKAPLSDADRFDEYSHDGIRVMRFHHANVGMGGQQDIVQGEYFNRLFYTFFSEWLSHHRPDVVHFLHLGRLTAAAIVACSDRLVPTVFSATDFWLVCPANQLRLPNGTMCGGPVSGGANCVKHFATISQPRRISEWVEKVPTWLFAVAVWSSRRGILPGLGYTSGVKSLSARMEFLRKAAAGLGAIIVPSDIMRKMLVQNGIPASRMTKIPYGLEASGERRPSLPGSAPQLRAVFIGTLAEHKGAHIAMSAVHQIARDIPIRLKVWGRTDEFPEYVRTLRDMAELDSRIAICGSFANADIRTVLDDADVLICPSIWYENTPLVIGEALAAGLPVLATNLGGMSEMVIHGVNGMLFGMGDSGELARQLVLLAGDRALLRQLATNARPHLSLTDHVTALEVVYGKVIAANSPPV